MRGKYDPPADLWVTAFFRCEAESA